MTSSPTGKAGEESAGALREAERRLQAAHISPV
jgi:hypothetical protein